MNNVLYIQQLRCKVLFIKESYCNFFLSDWPLQGTIPPVKDFLRDQQGEELHRRGGPIPHLHAAQAGLRQGERLRRAASVHSQLASIPL